MASSAVVGHASAETPKSVRLSSGNVLERRDHAEIS
jgi:hypothetical protein